MWSRRWSRAHLSRVGVTHTRPIMCVRGRMMRTGRRRRRRRRPERRPKPNRGWRWRLLQVHPRPSRARIR
eukprot:1153264-Prorocentrum_minimum.AAC.1